MPATKDPILVLNAVTLTGGAGPTSTGYQNLQAAYGGIWYISVTNDVNKQGNGVKVQAQIAPNQTAGNQVDFGCRQIAKQAASEETKFEIRIPPETSFTLLEIFHGDEDATITARFERLTQV